jgi:hypothetical protein
LNCFSFSSLLKSSFSFLCSLNRISIDVYNLSSMISVCEDFGFLFLLSIIPNIFSS